MSVVMLRRLIAVLLILCTCSLCYLSFNILITINAIESLQSSVYQKIDSAVFDVSQSVGDIQKTSSQLEKYLFWDSQMNYVLATQQIKMATASGKSGMGNFLLSEAEKALQRSERFSPLYYLPKAQRLSLLIGQGVSVDYALKYIDKLLSQALNDQLIKAEIARLCFELALVHSDSNTHDMILERLNRLFQYEMDYRGVRTIKRYSKRYGQQKLFDQISQHEL